MEKLNGNGFWMKCVIGIGASLLGVAVGYGMLVQKVNSNNELMKINSNFISINIENSIMLNKTLAEQNVKMEYMIKAIDEIKADMKIK